MAQKNPSDDVQPEEIFCCENLFKIYLTLINHGPEEVNIRQRIQRCHFCGYEGWAIHLQAFGERREDHMEIWNWNGSWITLLTTHLSLMFILGKIAKFSNRPTKWIMKYFSWKKFWISPKNVKISKNLAFDIFGEAAIRKNTNQTPVDQKTSIYTPRSKWAMGVFLGHSANTSLRIDFLGKSRHYTILGIIFWILLRRKYP